jgi:hypothetical protein
VKEKLVVIEIDPATLDQANGFDCVKVATGASNAANITTVLYYGGRSGTPVIRLAVDGDRLID